MAGILEMATLMWKAEIDGTKLNSGVKSAEGQINSLKERTSGFSNFLNKTVLGGILGLTGGIAGMAAIGLKGTMELEDSMAKFSSATGMVGEEADKVKGVVKELFKVNEDSYADITKTAEALHNNMQMGSEDIKKYAQNYMDFGKVLGMTGESAVNLMDDVSDAWSLANDELVPLMDKLKYSQEKYGLSVKESGNALKNLAPAFQGLGMNVNDALGYLNLFASTGLDSSSAITAFSFALRKVDSPKQLQDVIAQMQNTENATERAKIAVEIFGAKAGVAMANAIKPGTESIAEIQKVLEGADGAVSKASKNYDGSLKVQLNLAKKQVQGLLVEVGDKLAPAIKSFTEYLTTNAPQIRDKMGGAINFVSGAIDGLGKVIKFASDHSNIFIPIIAGIGTAMVAWKVVTIAQTVAQWALNVALNANPLGLIVLAIGAVIAIGVLLYKNWDTIKEKAGQLWEGIKAPFEAIGGFVSSTWGNIKEKTTQTWNNIKESTSKVWQGMKDKVAEHGGGIKGVLLTAMDGYKNIWSKGFNFIDNLTGGKLGNMVNSIKNAFGKIGETLNSWKNKISEIWNKIWDFKIPKVKLPHFTVTGSLNPIDWIKNGVPKLGVNWYKTGGIFNSPSVIGVGEAGQEAVIPIAKLASILEETMGRLGYGSRNNTNNNNNTNNVTFNNDFNVTCNTPFDISNQMDNFERALKHQMQRQGIMA